MTDDTPDEPITYEYLLSLAAAQVKQQPTWEWEQCERCRHKWHGLPCEACPCPSAHEEAAS